MNMNKLKTVILASMLSTISWSAMASEMFAFVGEYVDVQEWPYSEEYLSTCNCIVMDMRFKATYKVKQILYGKHEQDEVTFIVHDHYGFPDFAKQKTALLYLIKNNDTNIHLKYTWTEASPLKGEGYADCTDASIYDGNHDSKVKPYTFSPPINVDLSHSSEYVVNEYRNDPLYKVNGNVATCIKGISIEDIFNIEWPQIIEDYELDKKELLGN